MPSHQPDAEIFRAQLAQDLRAVQPPPDGWERVRSTLVGGGTRARRMTGVRWVIVAAALAGALTAGTVLAAAGGFATRVLPGQKGYGPTYPTAIILVCGGQKAAATPISLADARKRTTFPLLTEGAAEPSSVEWMSFASSDPRCAPGVRMTYHARGSTEVVEEGANRGSTQLTVSAQDQVQTTSSNGKQLLIHYTDATRTRVAAILWQADSTQGNVVFNGPVPLQEALDFVNGLS